MSRPRVFAAFGLGLLLTLAAATPAFADYATAPGYKLSVFASDFPNSGGVGPVGMAFDATGHLYVMDYTAGTLYRFSSTGGTAGTLTRVNAVPIDGNPAGLAFSKRGRLYVALQASGAVEELNPTTGAVLRTVADNTPGATGIATDPLSGDLFVSEPWEHTLARISNFESTGSPKVTSYTSDLVFPDGITFGAEGTIYVADGGQSNGHAKKVSPTSASSVTVTDIAAVDQIDGISLAAGSNPAHPSAIFGNTNSGNIAKVDLTGASPVVTDIVTGGTRGDFSVVGADGCLYATQTATIIKVTNADGTCSFASTVSVPVLRLSPPAQTQHVGRAVTITATLTNAETRSGHVVTFTVSGANTKVGTATTNAQGVATFSYTGSKIGSDSVSAATSANAQAVSSNSVSVTWTPVLLPQTGSPGRPPLELLLLILPGLLLVCLGGTLLLPRRP
jgi:sugar lactone lactonase YvrE